MIDKVQEKSKGGILNRLVGIPRSNGDRDAQTVGSALVGALAIGALFAICWQPKYWAAACMWGDACALVGMLLGFLFGIPRFLTRPGSVGAQSLSNSLPPAGGGGQPPVQQPALLDNAGGGGQPPVQQPAPLGSINTNLEEISDWLTKIIVGVSLVELQKVQTMLQGSAGFIAQSLGGPSQTSFAYGLMIYFSVSGFLGSYLLTRLYLQIAFRNAASRS